MANRQMDRRILRTRQMLQQAFMDIVQEKGFAAASIHEIAERANVNRGTFYLHFEDKYKLTESVIREQFQQMLAHALVPVPQWDRNTLYQLIQTVLECLEKKYGHAKHPSHLIGAIAPLLEKLIQDELTCIILTRLMHVRGEADSGLLAIQARVMSWAIFGPALQWSQETVTISAEQMAQIILNMVLDGMASLVPD